MEVKGNALADHQAKQAVLTQVRFLTKPSKDKSLEEFKEATIDYQCLAPDSEKEEC